MNTTFFLRLSLVPLLLAGLSLPIVAAADPWKDESGRGKKHSEWKDDDRGRGKGRDDKEDRGKDRDKAFKEQRKHAEKHWRREIERTQQHRERAVLERARDVDAARRAPVARAALAPVAPVARPLARSQLPTAAAPRPTASTYSAPLNSIEARRRAAVSGYINRHSGG